MVRARGTFQERGVDYNALIYYFFCVFHTFWLPTYFFKRK